MFVLNALPPVALPERGTTEPAEGQGQGPPLPGSLAKRSRGLPVLLVFAEEEEGSCLGDTAEEDPRTKASWYGFLAGALNSRSHTLIR